MRKILPILLCIGALPAYANDLSLDDALRATYSACVGIDDELAEMKKMAGINTAITAAGTAAGAGATVVGVVKASTDQKVEELEKLLKEIEESAKSMDPMTEEEITAFLEEFNTEYKAEVKDSKTIESEIDELNQKSKKLGNWRTGLMAGSTATNVAGAVIAGTNQVKGDLLAQIDACKASVKDLRNAMMQARMNGEDISEAQKIADACGEYEYADLSKINVRGKGAAISAGIGAATGLAGTLTSVAANTDATRGDNTEEGKKKEKGLNTASNILAGTTTAASATATVFNATQIKAIKQVAEIASKCTEVLK